MVSIIIPAHNEGKVIDRLLRQLTVDSAAPADVEIFVVSNGSSDDTAARARHYRDVHVLELEQGSKHLALLEGDGHATTFPRVYVDGDIEIDLASVRALVAALDQDGVEAVAPRRDLVLAGSTWPVRAHYRVWEQLPVVRDGLFGRGVVAVSEQGYARIADRPAVMGDDLYLNSRFAPGERQVVDAAVAVVRGPLTLTDLLRRRARTAQGNAEQTEGGESASSAGGSLREVARVMRHRPAALPDVAVFLLVTLIGRVRGRRMRARGSTTWLRDESSRG